MEARAVRSVCWEADHKKYRKYERYGLLLLTAAMAAAAAGVCSRGTALNLTASRQAERAAVMEQITVPEETSCQVKAVPADSRQRVIRYEVMEREPAYQLSETDYDTLLRIVEAEAGGEDENGKLLVANVVLNRVESSLFPDSVTEVVYQKEYGICQFSPVSDGRINRVAVSQETRRAVERAVCDGEDLSKGALYFAARSAAASDRMAWFDRNLTWLFAYGGHEFYV